MAYSKTNWTDRSVQYPNRFTRTSDGTYDTLTPAPGTVVNSGTAITAEALNNMENGIAGAVQRSGDTMTGNLGISTMNFNDPGGVKFDVYGNIVTSGTSSTSWSVWDKTNDTYAFRVYTDGSKKVVSKNNTLDDGNGNMVVGGQISSNSSSSLIITPSKTGYLALASPGGGMRMLISSDGLRVANSAYNNYLPVFASAFTVTSDQNMKKNIEPFTKNAEDLVNGSTVYEYNLNNELDGELKHIGLIMQEAPVEIVEPTGTGVDVYAMVGILWKAVQELSAKVKDLETKVQ